jgi:hypothetical protein
MATKPLPSRELVRQLLDYDPVTGALTWRPRDEALFKRHSQFLNWNNRYPGSAAGYVSEYGYVVMHFQGTLFKAHRLIWLLVHGGPVPEIDHIDGDRANNRIGKLRPATRAQNRANSIVSKNNSLGVKGVTLRKGRFIARIMHNGEAIRLGSFKTLEEATKARQEVAERLNGEFARHE